MGRPRLDDATRNRPMQTIRPNTWQAAIMGVLDPERFVRTTEVYFRVAERFDDFDWQVCRQQLFYLGRRGWIERQRVPGSTEMAQRVIRLLTPDTIGPSILL